MSHICILRPELTNPGGQSSKNSPVPRPREPVHQQSLFPSMLVPCTFIAPNVCLPHCPRLRGRPPTAALGPDGTELVLLFAPRAPAVTDIMAQEKLIQAAAGPQEVAARSTNGCTGGIPCFCCLGVMGFAGGRPGVSKVVTGQQPRKGSHKYLNASQEVSNGVLIIFFQLAGFGG